MSDGSLVMWTVYDHPRDFPHCFVARKYEVGVGGVCVTREVMVSDKLEKLRTILLKRGLTCLTRNAQDDPKIVETWL